MRLIFLLFLLGVCACTFQPDSITYHNISQETGVTRISLPGVQDTVYFFGEVELNVDADFDNRKVYDISLYLDDHEIILDGYTLHKYRFDSKDFQDGIYVLTLLYQIKSNSNSLADQLDAEVITVEYQHIAIVDNQPLEPLNIIQLTPSDGALQINWEPYTGRGFEKYAVGSLIDIDQQWINYTTIPGYAGGRINNNLYLFAKRDFVGQPFEYYDDLGFSIEQESNGIFTFSWDRNSYMNEFQFYNMEIFDAISGNYIISENLTDISTMDYKFDPLYFPSRYEVRFSANNYEVKDTTLGATFFKYPVGYSGIYKVILNNEKVYIKGLMNQSVADQVILKYDLKSGELLDDFQGYVDLSNDGEILIQYANHSISIFDADTKGLIKNIDLNQHSSIGQVINIIAGLEMIGIIDVNFNFYLIDIQEEAILQSLNPPFQWISPGYSFSTSGKYIYSNGVDAINLTDGSRISLSDKVLDPVNDRILEFGEGVVYSHSDSFSETKEFLIGHSFEFPNSFSSKYFSVIVDEPGDLSIKYFDMSDGTFIGSQRINPETYIHRSSYIVSDDLFCYINRRGELGFYSQKIK